MTNWLPTQTYTIEMFPLDRIRPNEEQSPIHSASISQENGGKLRIVAPSLPPDWAVTYDTK